MGVLRGYGIFLQQGSFVVERKPWITIIWLNMIANFLISLDQYYSPPNSFKGLTLPQTILKLSNMFEDVFINLLLLNIWEIATMFVNSSVYVSSIEMVPTCWRLRRSSSSAEPYSHQRWFLDMEGWTREISEKKKWFRSIHTPSQNHINNAWLWLIMVNYDG